MKQPRLVSLDVFRGLTVMFMIFVNNGAGKEIFSTLVHAKWNGLTAADLVFPFFLFVMGISTFISLRKSHFNMTRELAWKIGKRTLMLFLIGLFINWLEMAVKGQAFDFAHLRIMGVMQRIALCYGFTALAAIVSTKLWHSFRPMVWAIVILLLGYSLIILLGGGYNHDSATNILWVVDAQLLGQSHLYHNPPVDPEGLLSTLPSIAHTMIGFTLAAWAMAEKPATAKLSTLERFAAIGAGLVITGFLASSLMSYNKRIWSPSFVLVTCGIASLTLALMIQWIDGGGKTDTSTTEEKRSPLVTLCLVFGTNPLFLYVTSEVIAIFFGATGIKMTIYNMLNAVITNGYWASVAYSTLFVGLHALLGYPLWKRHIYIKL